MKLNVTNTTILLSCLALLALGFAPAAQAQPTFSKAFSPNPIGPGSTTTLTFTIDNTGGGLVTDLAFTDVLPGVITIATPASAMTTCTNAILDAPDGGGTISLSEGTIGAGESCTITVNVVGTATALNTSGDLTSSAGTSDAAIATLTVDTGRPGFSKSFSPSSIPLGATSTLTFTIDNTANAADVFRLEFNDFLPAGMVIAALPKSSTDCGSIFSPASYAPEPGESFIDFSALGSFQNPVLGAGLACTATVDVTTTTSGTFNNTSANLTLAPFGADPAGFASAALEVPVDFLNKVFLDDPVAPGGTVTLEFTIQNPSRTERATSIAFDDPLPAGLTFDSVMSDDCGGVLDTGTPSVLKYSGGGPLAASFLSKTECTLSVSLAVPAAATAGTFTNTTTAITADIGMVPVTGNIATDEILIELPIPILTKEFTDDPVTAGSTVDLQFTITNTSSTSMATDIAFEDFLPTILPTAVGTATSDCGGTVSFTPLFNPPPPGDAIPANLSLSGGILGTSTSCTIDITLNVAADAATGTYPNTTSPIFATVGGTIEGLPASDVLVVVAAPDLSKSFTDDPVAPGGTVTLEFTLTHHSEAPGDATDIEFMDDLTALVPGIPGLVAFGLPADECGGTVGGTDVISFTGGTLTPGETCVFDVTLSVPPTAPLGSHANTTSLISATVDALPVTGRAAADDLDITALIFTKEFTDDPVSPGGTVTLKFTLDNTSLTDDATSIFVDDNLEVVIPGLAPSGMLPATPCGPSSTLTFSGTTLSLAGGEVPADEMCMYSVTLLVPEGTPADTYTNSTTLIFAFMGTTPVFAPPATDDLVVADTSLALTKSFTDDPVSAGDPVTLQFTIGYSGQSDATDIGFTDDLDAALAGLAATALPADGFCGSGSEMTGTSVLTMTGGTLAPGGSCTFDVTLEVPAAADLGSFTNTTSAIEAVAEGAPLMGNQASDDLLVEERLALTKSFTDDPVAPGDPVNLQFTIDYIGVRDVTDIGFTDDLDVVLSGLAATALPADGFCGPGSQLTGTSDLTMTGGSLVAGGSCTFDVTLEVPADAALDSYTNTISDIAAMVGAAPLTGDPASDDLVVVERVEEAIPVNINSKISPQTSFPIFTPVLNTFEFLLNMTNTSSDTIFAPLTVSIDMLDPGPPDVEVDNSDNPPERGIGSIYEYSNSLGGDGKLDPGETTDDKLWKFKLSGEINFTFFANVFGVLPPVEPSPSPPALGSSDDGRSEPFFFVVDAKNGRVEIFRTPTSVPTPAQVPEAFDLQQNYPNPFNPETVIRYQLPQESEVKLSIYNVLGKEIRTLVDEKRQAGYHDVTWNGKDNVGRQVASGLYVYRIQAGEFTHVKKLMLLR